MPSPVAGTRPAPREIAITLDDLPGVSAVDHGIAPLRRLTASLLAAIRRDRIPAIGFVNEGKLESDGRIDTARVALLRRWRDAGLELGNHAYAHLDLHRVSLAEMKDDVLRGEAVTRRLLGETGRSPRWFRHPYLHTGRDSATRAGFEAFLEAHGYRVAPVTMDNSEYVFAAAYDRAVAGGDRAGTRRVRREYLDYMGRVVRYYEQQSVALFGREIRQVLLLHANALNAECMGELARALRARGYRFVTLERAASDSAFASADRYYGPAGITWIHRWAITAGKRGDFFAGEPEVPAWVERLANPGR